MTFREKQAWIALVTTLAVYGGYFAVTGRRVLSGASGAETFVAPLVATILIMAVLQTILLILAAATDPAGAREPQDERDRAIALRANRAGFYALQAGAFLAILSLFLWDGAAVIANSVLLAMALAEAVRAGFQVVSYRREAV